ncbi:uncharacterized protein LOC113240157 [Hyposmocoma kahamanoa]|uniref:uncharacterized protein LOC113240157 n=1 Tax=Hyposmocoma kahamanoa TaxID=1477025 RepID=UPI000E6DA08E|nr:uncharacterized protein LOC113240157 [Hyposmocoma kahamanoa]
MSDTSEDEDMSKFKEAVDDTFTKMLDKSRGILKPSPKDPETPKSERYLYVASHYNDVKVPEQLQRQIGAKVSNVIDKSIEFVDIRQNGMKKQKVKGGVKLFKDSEGYLSCEGPIDTYTEGHNRESKKRKQLKKKHIEADDLDECDKIKSVSVSGDYVMSKQDIKYWKSRRKEKVFKYKANGKSKLLLATE